MVCVCLNPEAPVVEPEPVPAVVETDRSEKIRAEIRDQIAKNAKLEQPEPSNELPEPVQGEDRFLSSLLRFSLNRVANLATVPATPSNAQSPEGLASEGRQKQPQVTGIVQQRLSRRLLTPRQIRLGIRKIWVKHFTERVKVLKPNLFYSVPKLGLCEGQQMVGLHQQRQG